MLDSFCKSRWRLLPNAVLVISKDFGGPGLGWNSMRAEAWWGMVRVVHGCHIATVGNQENSTEQVCSELKGRLSSVQLKGARE